MSRTFFNGEDSLVLTGKYTTGPWGPEGAIVQYPTTAVTNKMMDELGYKPFRVEKPAPGERATGWEIILTEDEWVKRPTGTEPIPPQTTTIILPREFKKRFTIAELRAVDEIADTPEHPYTDYVYAIRSEFSSAVEIDLADEEGLIPGIDILVEVGVLTEERKSQILEPLEV